MNSWLTPAYRQFLLTVLGPPVVSFFFFLMIGRPPRSPLFPSAPLSRSGLDLELLHGLGRRREADTAIECIVGRAVKRDVVGACATVGAEGCQVTVRSWTPAHARISRDRKSTRLNSSHGYISYAVFCLKK